MHKVWAQSLGDSEDPLSVRNIKQNLFMKILLQTVENEQYMVYRRL